MKSLEDLAAFQSQSVNVTGGDRPDRVRGAFVSPTTSKSSTSILSSDAPLLKVKIGRVPKACSRQREDVARTSERREEP